MAIHPGPDDVILQLHLSKVVEQVIYLQLELATTDKKNQKPLLQVCTSFSVIFHGGKCWHTCAQARSTPKRYLQLILLQSLPISKVKTADSSFCFRHFNYPPRIQHAWCPTLCYFSGILPCNSLMPDKRNVFSFLFFCPLAQRYHDMQIFVGWMLQTLHLASMVAWSLFGGQHFWPMCHQASLCLHPICNAVESERLQFGVYATSRIQGILQLPPGDLIQLSHAGPGADNFHTALLPAW